MPADGWWNDNGGISGCVAAYQPIGAADLATSYVNLRNSGSYDAAPGSAPGFDTALGWLFDGSDKYLETGIAADLKPVTVIVRAITTDLGNYRSWYSSSAPGGLHFYQTINAGNEGKPEATSDSTAAIGTANSTVASDGATSYVVAFTYSAGSVWTFYKNGSADGSGTTAVTFSGGLTGRIGRNGNYQFKGSIAALAVYDIDVSAGGVATITTAMQALPATATGQPRALRGTLVPGMMSRLWTGRR